MGNKICFKLISELLTTVFLFLFTGYTAQATWCVAGNSNRGVLTPTTSQTTTATFNPSGLVPYWSFSATAGVTYYFSLCPSANTEDAVLNIYSGASPGGALVAANDEGSCPNKSSLTFICPANGTYYVAANLYPWFSFATSGGLRLTNYICGATAGAALPYTENWTTSDVITPCTGWVAHGAGGEGDWYINDGTIGPAFACCQAGGSGNEVEFVGNQANLYGVGVTKTITLTSPKLNTTAVTSMTFSWKQSLGVTNSGASGSNNVIIKLQSSSDLITWTDRYTSPTYVATATLTTPVWQANQSVTFNPSANDIWLRFNLSAVPFKVWGFFVDNGGVTTMPVEMLSFTGENIRGKVLLNWRTATEINNDYFTLERSADGYDWNEIGKIKGAGNSSTVLSYEFMDEEIPSFYSSISTLYYRLKQTDYDGKYEYFGPISVSLSSADEMKLILKNPSNDELKGMLVVTEDAETTLDIVDLHGRIIQRHHFSAVKGSNLLQIDVSSLYKGIYFIKAHYKDKKIMSKFVKT